MLWETYQITSWNINRQLNSLNIYELSWGQEKKATNSSWKSFVCVSGNGHNHSNFIHVLTDLSGCASESELQNCGESR